MILIATLLPRIKLKFGVQKWITGLCKCKDDASHESKYQRNYYKLDFLFAEVARVFFSVLFEFKQKIPNNPNCIRMNASYIDRKYFLHVVRYILWYSHVILQWVYEQDNVFVFSLHNMRHAKCWNKFRMEKKWKSHEKNPYNYDSSC